MPKHTTRGAQRRRANEARPRKPSAGYVMPPWKVATTKRSLTRAKKIVRSPGDAALAH